MNDKWVFTPLSSDVGRIDTFSFYLDDSIDSTLISFKITVIGAQCDIACDGCTGPTSNDCDNCAQGYF